MAKTNAVWGIDIGQCSLKALRCTLDSDGKTLKVDAFDYIEHPKILSQPEAEPEKLVKEALEQFLSRNELKGDRIAISVAGQNGLSRFFTPPPVDAKRLPEIVKYEARQQIPFPLEEVIWDYQPLAGGAEVEGFALEMEVGLFAMKRDQVFRSIKPFVDADMELSIVQLGPLCLYNFASSALVDEEAELEYDSDNPPESVVLLSMGCDTTDLVITNGFRVWQRTIPLGGNHFTKQLTKELKLTFAKAEHIKRHAREAEDAKAIFQAMRPVFNDLLTEVQRSVGYFQSIDRNAKIRGLMMLGNAMKLPGLPQYLAKNLDYEILDANSMCWDEHATGADVLTAPKFKDNIGTFSICYGLCLQGLGAAKMRTNLVPREILTQRMIREKKPWAVASVAALMLGTAISYFAGYNLYAEVQPDRSVEGVSWTQVENDASSVSTNSSSLVSEDNAKVARVEQLAALGEEVVGNSDRRILWLELMRAVDAALPRTPGFESGQTPPDPLQVPFTERQELFLDYVESEYFTDLSTWYTEEVKKRYEDYHRTVSAGPAAQAGAGRTAAEAGAAAADPADPMAAPAATDPATPDAAAPAAAAPSADSAVAGEVAAADGAAAPAAAASAVPTEDTGPTGPGWVIEISGHHFYNGNIETGGAAHVRNTLLKNLNSGKIELPTPDGPQVFTFEEVGIGYAILAQDPPIDRKHKLPNPAYVPPTMQPGAAGGRTPSMPFGSSAAGGPAGARGAAVAEDPNNPREFNAPKYSFVVQFVWKETTIAERLEARRKAEEEQQQPAAAPQGAEPENPDSVAVTN